RNCDLARLLAEHLEGSSEFRLLAPVHMNVVCFTLARSNLTLSAIQNYLDRVRDNGTAYFSPTVYQGVPAIRAAVSNWQTEENDITTAFRVLQELAAKVPATR